MRRYPVQLALLTVMLGAFACSDDGETIREITKEVVPACSPTQPQGACDAGEVCFQGACVAASSLCSLTNPTGTCPEGMSCYSGGCVLAGALCSDANPTGACEIGDTCLEGDCVATASLCSATNPAGLCPPGQVCHDGLCAGEREPACDQFFYSDQPSIGVHTDVTGRTELQVDGLTFRDSSGDGALDPYEDWRLLEICRARDLVSKLTVAQKVGLMSEGSRFGTGTQDGTIPDNARAAIVDDFTRYALFREGSASAEQVAIYINNLQELTEGEPWGVPVTITADPLHGTSLSTDAETGEQSLRTSSLVSNWTAALGLGAAGDLALSRLYGDTVRREYKAMGFRWQLGPMADTATEPRWGRVNGTLGENAVAAARHVKEVVSGMQAVGDGGLRNGIAATMKHFPGAGPDEDGMDSHTYWGRFNVFPGDNFEYHLLPFQAAVDVGVAAVMPCYSVFKGQTDYDPQQVGAGFSHGLITELLKQRMGFTGMVTGDWGTLRNEFNMESLTPAQGAALWLEAGSHQFGSDSEDNFMDAYELGYVTEAQIDQAASKILEMTFKLGLFDDPYVDPAAAAAEVRSVENRTAGFIAQKKAIVLAKNRAHEEPPYACTGRNCPPDPALKYLPIDGSRFVDANENGVADPGEYVLDTNGDGVVGVFYDGVVDGLEADTERPDPVTDIFGAYSYVTAGGAGALPIQEAASLAEADIAVLRIAARSGERLDAGTPLSFDGPYPGTYPETSIRASIRDRNRVIDAFRVRDGYTDAAGTAVAAANPGLRIVLVMHMVRPGIVEPFIKGLTTLDELPGEPGSYPLVSDRANVDQTELGGVDAFLAEFGAFDRAVLDFVFDVNPIEDWPYGSGSLPMEIPSNDASVEAQFEDLPADTGDPTFRIGTGLRY